jgi:hypothetical protein
VETKENLCFLKKIRGRCGSVYGTKGAVNRKSLGSTDLDEHRRLKVWYRQNIE